MCRLTLIVLAFLLAGSLAAAQPHQDGLFATGLSHIYYVSSTGKVTSAWMPGIHMASTMHTDNRTVLVHDFLQKAILKVDPKTFAVVGTLITHGALGNSFSVQSLDIDHNGDVFFTATQPVRGVYKIDGQALKITSVVSAASTAQVFGNVTDLRIDIDTGDLIVGDLNTAAKNPIYRLKRDGSAHVTLGTGFDLLYGLDKHVLTGHLYVAAWRGSTLSTGRSLQVLRAGTSVPQTFLNHPVLRSAWGPEFDRASAPVQRIFSGAWEDRNTAGSSGIWTIDVNSASPNKLASLTNGGFANVYHVVPIFGRNLQTVRQGVGIWNVQLNCPGLGGNSYAIGVSAIGVRPAVPLADGRRIPLAPDVLTFLAVNNLLVPFLQNSAGKLKNGVATAFMNLRALLPGAKGVRLWLCAVILDPKAPLGIALITDPVVLVIE